MLFDPPSMVAPTLATLRVNAGTVPYSSILGAEYGLRAGACRAGVEEGRENELELVMAWVES
jgi:hypothetical protein